MKPNLPQQYTQLLPTVQFMINSLTIAEEPTTISEDTGLDSKSITITTYSHVKCKHIHAVEFSFALRLTDIKSELIFRRNKRKKVNSNP
ncbi:MAG: hypothetical protein WA667_23475 [Candidatus Nitrosopolaris sp.]